VLNIAFDYFDKVIAFIKEHALIIIVLLLVAFIIYFLFFRNRKKELKPISRSNIERLKFIERMRLNKTTYKWLYRGNECIGIIRSFMPTDVSKMIRKPIYSGTYNAETKKVELKEEKEKEIDIKPILEMVVKPILNLGIKIPNPFSSEICIRVDSQTIVDMDRATSSITIDEKVTFEKVFGIFYDRRYEQELLEYARVTDVMRTDLESLGSEYYVEAQKNSVLERDRGYHMALAEKELQTELAKKRGKQSTI